MSDDGKFTCEKIFRHMIFVINGSLQYAILVKIRLARFYMQKTQLLVGGINTTQTLGIHLLIQHLSTCPYIITQ